MTTRRQFIEQSAAIAATLVLPSTSAPPLQALKYERGGKTWEIEQRGALFRDVPVLGVNPRATLDDLHKIVSNHKQALETWGLMPRITSTDGDSGENVLGLITDCRVHGEYLLADEFWFEQHVGSRSWRNLRSPEVWKMHGTGIVSMVFVVAHQQRRDKSVQPWDDSSLVDTWERLL